MNMSVSVTSAASTLVREIQNSEDRARHTLLCGDAALLHGFTARASAVLGQVA